MLGAKLYKVYACKMFKVKLIRFNISIYQPANEEYGDRNNSSKLDQFFAFFTYGSCTARQ